MKKLTLHRKGNGDWFADWNGHHYDIEHGAIGYNITREDDTFQWRFAETLAEVRIGILDEVD